MAEGCIPLEQTFVDRTTCRLWRANVTAHGEHVVFRSSRLVRLSDVKPHTCNKQVVALMMDMKRLNLRREALLKLRQRSAEKTTPGAGAGAGSAEKIKLRSR